MSAEWRRGDIIDVDGKERRVYIHEPKYRLCGWRTAVPRTGKLASTQ